MHRGRRGIGLLAALFALVMVWTGCGATDRTAPRTPPGTAAPPGSLPPPGPAVPAGFPQPITFAFAGDTQFGDQQDTEAGAVSTGLPLLADRVRTDPQRVLSAVAPALRDADLAMVNLETAVTDGGRPVTGKTFHFRSPPSSFAALRAAGVDVATMANNHALDYGASGLQDTFDAIKTSGFPVVGIGHDAAEAFRPYVTTVKGQRVGILSAVDWLEPALIPAWSAGNRSPGVAGAFDPARLIAAVRATRPMVDILILFMHWGTEQDQCADGDQRALARILSAAGADIIVGAHSHRVQGAGRLGTSFVAYGLGNFTWWREDGESGRTGVLTVTATGRRVNAYSWVPARIRRGVPVPLSGTAAAADGAEWQRRRGCTGLSP